VLAVPVKRCVTIESKSLAVYIRVYMNSRPKSEDPVRLIRGPLRSVPTSGFCILEGFLHAPSGGRVPLILPKRFIGANPGGSKLVRCPDDLYLEFARAPIEASSVLNLSSKYGWLGAGRHLHEGDGRPTWGETLDDWVMLISDMKFWLEAWFAILSRDTARAKHLLWQYLDPAVNPFSYRILKNAKPIELLREDLIGEVNRRINAGLQIIGPCGYPGCKYKHPPRLAAHVRQAIRIDLRCTRTTSRGPQIDFAPSGYDLRSALWLQFANAITGKAVIKRCELCGGFMDVTSSARPGAKRMHDRCSLAGRMRRYRAKSRG
jgi:hypothetical protein